MVQAEANGGSSGLLVVVSSCLQSHKNMASHGFSIYQALGGHMATLVNVALLSKTCCWAGSSASLMSKEEKSSRSYCLDVTSLSSLCLRLISRSPVF